MHINLGKSLHIFSVYITRIQDYLLNDCDLYFRWCNTVKPAINMANDLPTRLDVLILRLASKHIVEALVVFTVTPSKTKLKTVKCL